MLLQFKELNWMYEYKVNTNEMKKWYILYLK